MPNQTYQFKGARGLESQKQEGLCLSATSMSEDVNHHINSISNAWGALKKLKDLYESHSELEFIQLQLKVLNLELKENDPMALALVKSYHA